MALLDAFRSKPQLDPAEAAELDRCEQIIKQHRQSYIAIGAALDSIRERKLYRITHATFEEYLRERWQLSTSHAYRIIAASQVAEETSHEWDEVPSLAEATRKATASRPKKKRKASRPKPIRLRVPGGLVIIEPGRGFTTTADLLAMALQKATAADAADSTPRHRPAAA